MKQMSMKKHLSLFLCMMLIAAMALFTTGCKDDTKTEREQAAVAQSAQEQTTQPQAVGEGNTVFAFTVVDADGMETAFEVHTDKATVGEALLDCGLIAGDEGDYGLYVKTVNGVTADYNADGAYWSFYVDGEYAQAGVDTTSIEEGRIYTFKYEKA